MPVIKTLAAINAPQVVLGTDLAETPNRQNIIVFNSANVQATADVVIRRACDDALLESRRLTIPPNTVLQFGGSAAPHRNLHGIDHRNHERLCPLYGRHRGSTELHNYLYPHRGAAALGRKCYSDD